MRARSFAVAIVLFSSSLAAAAPARVGVTHGLVKIRPSDPAPATTSIALTAARNELEPFQIVVHGGDSGVTGVNVSAAVLTGPAAGALQVSLYREGLHDVVVASNTEGATGPWPDPLIPAVDSFFGEVRNAFPFDAPAGESRAVWAEIHVPPSASAGNYSGTVQVSGTGLTTTDISVSLRVRTFSLPSTATLRSAFGMGWNAACVAHRGSYEACGDSGVEEFHVLYARAALDHRVSLETVVYDGPHDNNWTHFDALYGPLLDGTAATLLQGARLTSIRLTTDDATEMVQWHDHFNERGWLDALFDYTCDEPPAGCAFSDIPTRAQAVQSAGIRTLVTTDIDEMLAHDLTSSIDIATPVINYMHDRSGANRRADYDNFLSGSSQKRLWSYQSCMSHGCGDGCVGTTDDYFTGWPSYMIDTTALQNRAMEWLSYRYDIGGELYFETTWMLPQAWDTQCDFSGNGDGTLFYPGTPSEIGGTNDIPIASIRLKLVREGMEDYEYLKLLESLGGGVEAHAEASALFPAPYLVGATTAEALLAARDRVGNRIEALLGGSDGGVPIDAGTAVDAGTTTGEVLHVLAAPAVTVDGVVGEFASSATVQVQSGVANATFRVMWDAVHLYVAAAVSDPLLWLVGTGRDGELYDGDSVEVMLDPARDRSATPDSDDRHVIVNAGGDVLDARGAGSTEDRSLDMQLVTAVIRSGVVGDANADEGYTVEMAIPWTAIGVTPHAGLVMGADLGLNDHNGSLLSSVDWAGLTAFANPAQWNTLVLDAAPVDGGVGSSSSATTSTSLGSSSSVGSTGGAASHASSAAGATSASTGGTTGEPARCSCDAAGDDVTPPLGFALMLAVARLRRRAQ